MDGREALHMTDYTGPGYDHALTDNLNLLRSRLLDRIMPTAIAKVAELSEPITTLSRHRMPTIAVI